MDIFQDVIQFVFWLSFLSVFYAYLGYPLILMIISTFKKTKTFSIDKGDHNDLPSVSMIIPVHNEEKVIESKISNLLSLEYEADKLEILIISDGSTDQTKEIIEKKKQVRIYFHELSERRGKAAALNHGLKLAKNEIIVFSDASIILERNALQKIVKRFSDPRIGCVSGEDHIEENGGEGFYGRYELFLRNLESNVASIVGASGSFYAQKKVLCQPFIEGMAPDFLSVLNIIEKNYVAVTEPSATGKMSSLKKVKEEFDRKVRTLLRGMTTLSYKKHLLNPFKFGLIAFELISHKIFRWLVPFFLLIIIISNIFLISESILYQMTLILQLVFYLIALLSYYDIGGTAHKFWGKIPLYFVSTNASIVMAFYKYLVGFRQEIWNPSRR